MSSTKGPHSNPAHPIWEMPPWLARRHQEGIQPASRQGLSGRSAQRESEQGSLPAAQAEQGSALQGAERAAPVSRTTGEPAPRSSPQGLFGKARTPRSTTSINHMPFPKPGNYKLGSGWSKRGRIAVENSNITRPSRAHKSNMVLAFQDLRNVLYRLISSGLIASCLRAVEAWQKMRKKKS